MRCNRCGEQNPAEIHTCTPAWADMTFEGEVVRRMIDEAVLVEREACAKLCEAIERKKWETLRIGGSMSGVSAADCTQAIRARGRA